MESKLKTDTNQNLSDEERPLLVEEPPQPDVKDGQKGPLSFFSGAATSFLLAWLCLGLSGKTVAYFIAHQPNYSSPIAQSIASALKTLVIGMTFLATFSFGFIGLGLTLVFFRSLFSGKQIDST